MRVSWAPDENWFQSKQQVSREIYGVIASLRQLDFVCMLHESIYYFQNISIRRLTSEGMLNVSKQHLCRQITILSWNIWF